MTHEPPEGLTKAGLDQANLPGGALLEDVAKFCEQHGAHGYASYCREVRWRLGREQERRDRVDRRR